MSIVELPKRMGVEVVARRDRQKAPRTRYADSNDCGVRDHVNPYQQSWAVVGGEAKRDIEKERQRKGCCARRPLDVFS